MNKIKKETANASNKVDESVSIDPENLELLIDRIYPVFSKQIDFETMQKIESFMESKQQELGSNPENSMPQL